MSAPEAVRLEPCSASEIIVAEWRMCDRMLSCLNGIEDGLSADQMRRRLYGEIHALRPEGRATPPLPGDVGGLIEYVKQDCNRYANGQCQSRHCLVRGGWTGGPPDYDTATCEEHEIATALASYAAERNEMAKVLEALLSWATNVCRAHGFTSKQKAIERARALLATLRPTEGEGA